MKAGILISLILLGFLVGVPFFIAGKQYWEFIKSLSIPSMVIIVLITISTGILIEGVLKKAIK